MKPLAASLGATVPAILSVEDEAVRERFLEFFAAQIRNANTRRAYVGDVERFLEWAAGRGVRELAAIRPLHVAGYIELLTQTRSAPTTKRCLAALRGLFDWLVVGRALATNPAASVRGPKYSQREGKTPILTADEARLLLESVDTRTLLGLRDRALIATMLLSFARVSAVTGMNVEDFFSRGRRYRVRLHEKGGKLHEMPCSHRLESYLLAWLEASGLAREPKAALFPSFRRPRGSSAAVLTRNRLRQANAYEVVRRHAVAVGLPPGIGNHSLRGTGITSFLTNNGSLEKAQRMANHVDLRTTQLYDRRSKAVTVEDVERTLL
jgi:site-specific recombinase XerD